MKRTATSAVLALLSVFISPSYFPGLGAGVDFRFSPPEWQTSICLPDDPSKTLVDKSGELLYHYGQGGREFATRIGVDIVPNAQWQSQELFSPRVPIVRTHFSGEGLKIEQEAFAVTGLRQPGVSPSILLRTDSGGANRNWAKPPAGADPSLANIAVHMGGTSATKPLWSPEARGVSLWHYARVGGRKPASAFKCCESRGLSPKPWIPWRILVKTKLPPFGLTAKI